MAAPHNHLRNGTTNMTQVTDEDLTGLIIAQQEHTISELVKAEEARM